MSPKGTQDADTSGEKKSPPPKLSIDFCWEAVVIGKNTFRILKLWLNSNQKGTQLLTQAKPVQLYDSAAIIRTSGQLITQLTKAREENRFDSPNLESFAGFLNFSAEANAQAGSVKMPYKMYGEYGPSVTALLTHRQVIVTHPAIVPVADANSVASVIRWFAKDGKHVTVDALPETNYGKFSDLHLFWKGKDIPGAFRLQLSDLACEAKLQYFNALYADAAGREPKLRPKPSAAKAGQKKAASVASGNTVSRPAPGRLFRFCIWIRNAAHNLSKNMTVELLDSILEELAVALAAFTELKQDPNSPRCELVLLGDPNSKDAPEKLYASPVIRERLTTALEAAFPRYAGVVSVVDLRGFVETRGGIFDDFHGKTPLPPFDSPMTGLGKYMNYLDQWLIYYYLGSVKAPEFIVGTEAGNMDAIGYAGTPVISIDKTDATADTPRSLLTDRIGQYTLVTPLWQVVNFGGSVTVPFREYLRGAMLRFMFFTRDNLGGIHEAFQARKEADDDSDLPQVLADRFERIHVEGDGNCLYRALAVGDGGHEDQHFDQRYKAASYARTNFSLVVLNAGAHQPHDSRAQYFDVMSVPAEGGDDQNHWGGYVEIEAWARVTGKQVTVYSLGNAPVVFNEGRPKRVYLSWTNGNHYDCLKEKTA